MQQEVENQIKSLSRQDILAVSIAEQGRIYVVDQLNHAFEFVNDLAPEHLEILVENPFEQRQRLKCWCNIFRVIFTRTVGGLFCRAESHLTNEWNGKIFVTIRGL